MDDTGTTYATREEALAAGHRVGTAYSLGYPSTICQTCKVFWPCPDFAQASERQDEADASAPEPTS